MKEVPNIISVKDLLLIKDMLNFNLLMNSKINCYLNDTEESDSCKLLNKAMKMHLDHYKELLDIFD